MNELALIPESRGAASNGATHRNGSTPAKAGLHARLTGGKRMLHLHGEPLEWAAGTATRRDLINRFFALPTLKSVLLDARRGKARLHFEEEVDSAGDALDALAFAMRGRTAPQLALAHAEILDDEASLGPIEITRVGHELTFWKMEAVSPGRYRLAHPLLRSDIIREQVLRELATVPDVLRTAASHFRDDTIHVWARPHRVDPALFLEVLDPVLTEYFSKSREFPAFSLKQALVNTNLVFAPISDFLFPPLGIFNALLVGSINRSHIIPAFRDLRQGRTNLHLLYLSIGALTLLTFSFFAAAVMYWLLMFWPRKARQLRAKFEADFLAHYRRRPRRVWVEKKDSVIETPVRELTESSVVVVNAGDIIPGDGVVVSGTARVHDCFITGNLGPGTKTAGDPVYAASQVIEGELRMRATSWNGHTAASRIAAWYVESLEKSPRLEQTRAKRFAEAAVLPVLAIGALALTRGGLHMAKAAIRPDYMTGPGIAEDFVDLATTLRAAQEGILVANTSSLEGLVGCDCLILDDSVDWRVTGLQDTAFVQELHRLGIAEVAFLSSKPAGPMAKLGFDVVRTGFSTEAKHAYISQRRHFDHAVVYVGNCETEASAAAQATLAVAVVEPPHVMPVGARPALLGADLIKVLRLMTLAHKTRAEFNTAYGISLVPNVASVLGALYLHTSVDTSVVLSNLGTLVNYIRYRSMLRMSAPSV